MFEWTLTSVIIAASIGGGVGFLSGLFGVGGGFLLVPVLNVVIGVPMSIAVGSTACYTLGPATTAMLARSPRAGFLELPLILCGGLFCGVWLGAGSLTRLKSAATIEVLGRQLPGLDLLVLVCYAVLMSGIAVLSLTDALNTRNSGQDQIRRRGLLTQFRVPPVAVIPDLSPSVYSIPLMAVTGLCIGFLSGFLGMSGGLVLVPAAIYLLGLRPQDATTLTIVIVWLVSLQSTFMHAQLTNIQLELVVSLLICGTIGANLGARVGLQIEGSRLKLGFGLLVVVSAGIVFVKLWRLWNLAVRTPV